MTLLPPAYPLRYYDQRWDGWWITLAWFALLGGAFAGFTYALCVGAFSWQAIVGWAFSGWLLQHWLREEIRDSRLIRIIPYYDQSLPKAGTFLSGHALARNCLRLDELAKAAGVRTISEFGFSDALRGEPIVWRPCAEGLTTISALCRAVKNRPESVDDAVTVLADLQKVESAFERGSQAGIRFGFLLEIGDGTNGMVWEIRKGYI